MKEYFILSDIHSQYDLLMNALNKAKFEAENNNHILLIAGDILDRGQQGDKVIRFLESLILKNRVLGVLGNHDSFLLDVVNNIIDMKKIVWNCEKNGFLETLQLGYNSLNQLQLETDVINDISITFNKNYPVFVKWLRSIPLFMEFPKHVIVHGFLDFSLDDWRDTSKQFAIWERGFNSEVPDSFQKHIIFGHTPNFYINEQNDIIIEDKKIMIDGGAASNTQINILRLIEDEM